MGAPLSLVSCVIAASAALAQAVDLVPFGANWDYMHPNDGTDPAVADTDFDTTWFLAAGDFAATYNGPSFATPVAALVEAASPGAQIDGQIENDARMSTINTFGGGVNEIQREIVSMAGLRMPANPVTTSS